MTYEFTLPRKTLFGVGSLQKLGEEAKRLGSKALLVTGRGSMRKAGVLDRAVDCLRSARVEVLLFEGVEPNPSVETIDSGAGVAKEKGCDLVIGLGGGSVIDAAKAMALMVKNPGSVADYQLERKTISQPGLPMIAIPTTSGTGAETNHVSVITNTKMGIKRALKHPYMTPSVAILDPSLTLTLPPDITAATGMDALGHAVESYVSTAAHPFSEALSLRAIELIGANLREAVWNGRNITARENMAMAAYLAGMALMAGTGFAHLLSHPMSASFGVSHGQSIALLLPYVMESNLPYSREKFARIASALGEKVEGLSLQEASEQAVVAVRKLAQDIKVPQRLREVGIEEKDFPEWIRLAKLSSFITTNPRPTSEEALMEILNKAK